MFSSPKVKPKLSSDTEHNRNCYKYLLQLKPYIDHELIALDDQFKQLSQLPGDYNEQFAYGDLYSSIISSLEKIVEQIEILSPSATKSLDHLIAVIYDNDNQILHDGEWINQISADACPKKNNTSNTIKEALEDPKKTINRRSPRRSGSISQALHNLFSDDFKPQSGTNLPSIKNISADYRIEYRFSTQAQRHKGEVRINPLFKHWLKIKASKCLPKEIVHIYFNNLAYDRIPLDIPGRKERAFTEALHELEQIPELKILIITLPANEGLMDSSDYEIADNALDYAETFAELLGVAKGNPHKSGISDFIISPSTRNLIFGSKEEENLVLLELLDKSFEAHGINPKSYLSTAQRQAVWVHFVKYELTNYILEKIKPKGYNFSCKDAIDRGALSSTYYNLMKSFASMRPMQRAEFERSLDIAAAQVKGRGMNFHRKIIWNALNSYVNAHFDLLARDENKSWLIYWCDMNCPRRCAEKLLKTRIEQNILLFNSLGKEKQDLKEIGLNLLNTVQQLCTHQVGRKRLLLEVVSRTSELMFHNSENSLIKYRVLASDIKIKYPALLVLGGLIEALIGILLYLPSLGYSQKLIKHGWGTAKSGFFASYNNNIASQMADVENKSQVDNSLTA